MDTPESPETTGNAGLTVGRQQIDRTLVWEIAFQFNEVDYSVARDLSIGIALASTKLSSQDSVFRRSDRRQGAIIVLILAAHLPNNEDSTRLLEEVVSAASSIDFAGYLTGYLTRSSTKVGSSFFRNVQPDAVRITTAFDLLVKNFISRGIQLTSISQDDLSAIVLASGDRNFLNDFLKRELTTHPLSLPNILKIGAHQRLDTDEQPIIVESFSSERLAELVPLSDIAIITDSIPLEAWSNDVDRELVRRFRERIPSNEVDAT